ncbi:MAG TPA: phospholipid carrier-dependent glycosyltransferase [Streptosporangiaceae bacterium]
MLSHVPDHPATGDGAAGDDPAAAAASPAGAGGETLTGVVPRRPGPGGRLAGLLRRNWLFTAVLLISVIPRVIVMLGYQPAILFKLDTYDYLWDAAHLQPDPINPNGYSLFLWLVKPFHSFLLIAAIQHVLGLVSAVLVYAVLRRYNVRPWIATAATVTVLFDPGQFILEQIVLADLLAMVLMVIAFCVLLLARDKPSVLRVVFAGLLMGASATVRPTTLPLILFLATYLLLTRAGWLRAGAALLAGLLPIVAYMGWFASVYGSFNFTNSNGLFLWSRTMTFANCAKINPPADLRPLCPENQPRQQALPAGSGRLLPKIYLWDHTAWMWTDPAAGPKGVRPDTQAFTRANNDRALRFALAAIKAQPLSYAHAVADDLTTIFTSKDVFLFPGRQPVLQGLGPFNKRYALAAVQAYAGSTKGIGPYLGRHFGVRLHQPFAHWVRIYQTYVFMPGPLFALLVAAGLAGLLIPRRRTGAGVLLWISAAVIVVLPIAEHEYTYRYVIPALPLLCMTLALALRTKPGPGDAAALAGAGADRETDATMPVPVLDGGPGDTDLFTPRADLPKRTPRTSHTGPLPAVHNTGPIPAIGYEDEFDGRAPDDTSPQGIAPGQGG